MHVIPKPTSFYFTTPVRLTIGPQPVTIDPGPFADRCLTAFSSRHVLTFTPAINLLPMIIFKKADEYQPEEYDLSITPTTVTIIAACDQGIIWALSTLSQLMDDHLSAPCCQVHDKPRYTHRGLSLDCARHFFPVREIKRILDQMSCVKMNRLHWHLTDDQGWRIESSSFPGLHRQHGEEYYSQEQIRALVDYADARGIEIIPEIDMPGHITALLAAYPQYSCTGQPVQLPQSGGIYTTILCAGRESTYQLIETLLNEIVPLFPSSFFHIGGDEAPKKTWQECPACQKVIKENNLQNEKDLQGYFSNRVIKLLAHHNKTAICWNDALEAANLDSSAVIQYWSVQYADHLAPCLEHDGRFIYSDMFALYLDYPHSMISLQRLYESPIEVNGTDYADHPALTGLEICVWSERLTDAVSLENNLFPRLYAAAEKMWGRTTGYADFHQRLQYFLPRHHPQDMNSVPEQDWNPAGEARRMQTLAFMTEKNETMSPEARAMTAEHFQPNEQFQRRFAQSFFDPADSNQADINLG